MEEPILLSDPFFAFPSMVFPPPPPPPSEEDQLVIVRQNSLAVEKVSQNGIQKNVHVVVKNQPFLIQVAPTHPGSIDFTATPLEVRLLYDCDKLKEVDFVKLKPLEARCHVNERGDQVTMEIRLKVLSSQLEDMFFRLRLVAVDSATKQRLDHFSVVSEPIKVVSKPEQAKKRKVAPTVIAPVHHHHQSSNHALPPQILKEKKEKKDKQEFLAEKLGRVEGTVLQQQQLLAELQRQNELHRMQNAQLIQQLQMANLHAEKRAQEAQWEVINCKKNKKEQEEPATPSAAFEAAFNTFIAAYNKVPCEDKSERIRRVMRTTGMRDTEVVCEMLDLFAAEGLQRTVGGRMSSPSSSSNCNDNHAGGNGDTCGCAECPFKKELERIDDFYNDFLSNPSIL